MSRREPDDRTGTAASGPGTGAVVTVATARLDLPAEPASARTGDFLRAEVTGCDAPTTSDRLDVLELLVSELTNAVVHARSDLTLIAELQVDGVRVAVRDLDPQQPVLCPRDVTAAGGRGLGLVEVLADAWGVEQVPDGKDVWFYLRFRGST